MDLGRLARPDKSRARCRRRGYFLVRPLSERIQPMHYPHLNSWAAGHGGTSSVLKPMAASGSHVKALGLMIPQAFLLRACEVIE